jgi:rhodanese-related sulfurtransferase
MMKKNISIFLIILIAFSAFYEGCLRDNITPAFNLNMENSALILNYLEEHGDIMKTDSLSIYVQSDEVYNNKNYLIIDVRSKNNFEKGHIPGAINIQNDSLVQYLNKIVLSDYTKIILVSATGQSSSYYTCLLRLYGFYNVYSMLFGMAQWNTAFADTMIHNSKDVDYIRDLNDSLYTFPPKEPLPSVTFSNTGPDIQSKIRGRIAGLIKKGFIKDTVFVTNDYFGTIRISTEVTLDSYVVCYGNNWLYMSGKGGILGPGHLPNAVQYHPGISLRSDTYLQTLPPNKAIIVYGYSGDISAFVVAYLRVLGYDAKTLLFGANGLIYSYMVDNLENFIPFVYQANNINNFPYVTGNQ